MEIASAVRRVGEKSQAMLGIVKAFRRPPTDRRGDRNGGFTRLLDIVAPVFRYPASPRRTLLAKSLVKTSP